MILEISFKIFFFLTPAAVSENIRYIINNDKLRRLPKATIHIRTMFNELYVEKKKIFSSLVGVFSFRNSKTSAFNYLARFISTILLFKYIYLSLSLSHSLISFPPIFRMRVCVRVYF